MPRSLCFLVVLLGLAGPSAHAQSPTTVPAPSATVPDANHPWTPEDYRAAATAWTNAPAGTLPRRGSGAAGEMFARLVNPENLASLSVPTTPLPTRLALSLAYADGASKLLAIYLTAFNKGEPLGPEVLALSAHVCAVAAAEWSLVDVFQKGLDKSAPDYETRMKGLDRMREGTATVISGVLVTLTETDAYGKDALTVFANQLQATFPALMHHVPETSQASLGLRLETQAGAEPPGAYHDALMALLATVKP